MGTRTSHAPGCFSWVDLQASDPAAAKTFYTSLFGWDYEDIPIDDAGGVYAMALVGGERAAAIGPIPQGDPSPPHWNSYVTVESADASASRAAELGGAVDAPAFDIFDAGRMAVITDPTGAYLCLWEPKESPGASRVNDTGCFTWNELGTKDPATAATFFADLFGWTYDEMDMGGGEIYRTIKLGDRMNGGIRGQTEREAAVPANWLAYFTTESTNASVEKTVELGGSVLAPAFDLPTGSRIAVVADPQGAPFAFFEGETED